MKKGTRIILLVIGVLSLIGLAYYFLVYRKQKEREGEQGEGATDTGGVGTSTSVGIRGCTDPSATNYNPSATINDGSCVKGAGSDVYLKTPAEFPGGTYPAGPSDRSGIPVYRENISDSVGSYLIGVTRQDWLGGNSIGKVIESTNISKDGSPGNWTKVRIQNWDNNQLMVYTYTVQNGYTLLTKKIGGDVWFATAHIKTF